MCMCTIYFRFYSKFRPFYGLVKNFMQGTHRSTFTIESFLLFFFYRPSLSDLPFSNWPLYLNISFKNFSEPRPSLALRLTQTFQPNARPFYLNIHLYIRDVNKNTMKTLDNEQIFQNQFDDLTHVHTKQSIKYRAVHKLTLSRLYNYL